MVTTAVDAEVHRFDDDGDTRAARLWRFDGGRDCLTSAPVGGGWRRVDWLANVGVVGTYARTDLDAHGAELAARVGLVGTGAMLLTAADVTMGVTAACDGVHVDATVGITKPTWAADEDDSFSRRDGTAWVRDTSAPTPTPTPGTINVVVQLPVALHPAAAVNAVMCATEAKSQALFDAGIPGTGTASDAVALVWPTDGSVESFAGPRSPWGARLARAVHAAMVRGIEVHP